MKKFFGTYPFSMLTKMRAYKVLENLEICFPNHRFFIWKSNYIAFLTFEGSVCPYKQDKPVSK